MGTAAVRGRIAPGAVRIVHAGMAAAHGMAVAAPLGAAAGRHLFSIACAGLLAAPGDPAMVLSRRFRPPSRPEAVGTAPAGQPPNRPTARQGLKSLATTKNRPLKGAKRGDRPLGDDLFHGDSQGFEPLAMRRGGGALSPGGRECGWERVGERLCRPERDLSESRGDRRMTRTDGRPGGRCAPDRLVSSSDHRKGKIK